MLVLPSEAKNLCRRPGFSPWVAQRVKCLPAVQETGVQSLCQEDPLEKKMATHSSILAWKIPWTEEPDRLQSMGSQRVLHNWATNTPKPPVLTVQRTFGFFLLPLFGMYAYQELIVFIPKPVYANCYYDLVDWKTNLRNMSEKWKESCFNKCY